MLLKVLAGCEELLRVELFGRVVVFGRVEFELFRVVFELFRVAFGLFRVVLFGLTFVFDSLRVRLKLEFVVSVLLICVFLPLTLLLAA